MQTSSIVFGPAFQPEIRRSRYESTVPYGVPFEQADGDVQVLGYERQVFFGGPDRVEKCPDAPQRQGWGSWSGFGTSDRGPENQPGAFVDDGTVFFATSGGVVRGVREGKEVFSAPAGGKVCTPIVLDGAGDLAYGIDSSRVCVLGQDGAVKRDLAVPALAGQDQPEKIASVHPLADGGFVFTTLRPQGQGYHGHVARLRPDGEVAWSKDFDFLDKQDPVVSPDGTTLCVGGVAGRFTVLGMDSGEEKWGLDLGGAKRHTTAPAAFDPDGNVCTLTNEGTVYRLTATGAPVHPPVETHVAAFQVNDAKSCLALDASGDICVTPDWRHFLVYDPVGRPVMGVEGKDLFFHPGDYIHGFSLSRDRQTAYVLGSSTLASISLPPPLARVAEEALKRSQDSAAPTIEREDGFVTINGIKVPRKGAAE